jgi:hypothetical protein
MKFPRTSQEAFGIRFQTSDFEEERVSRYDVAFYIVMAIIAGILWLG